MTRTVLLTGILIGFLPACYLTAAPTVVTPKTAPGKVIQAKEAETSPAPDFSLKDLEGKKVSLKSELAKSDGVVLNFWASWCTACADEIPELNDFKKKYPKYVFLGVNVAEENSKAQKFVKRFSYPYKVVMDPHEEVAKKYGIDGLPITIVINKSGKIIFRGSRPPEKI